MANFKSIIINTAAATVGVLFIIGAMNMDAMPSFADYANSHLGGYMAFVFWLFMGIALFLTPVIVGVALEVPMWESNTRVGFVFANAMHNARDSWRGFGAVFLFGGLVNTFSVWGILTLICG